MKRLMRRFVRAELALFGALSISIVGGLMSASSAVAQNAQWNALFDRIIRLEANVKNLSRAGAGSSGYQQPQSNAQMRQLLSEIRQMRQQLLTMDARLRRLEKLSGRSGSLRSKQPAIRPQRQFLATKRTDNQVNFAQSDLEQYSIDREPQIYTQIGDGNQPGATYEGVPVAPEARAAPVRPVTRPVTNWQSSTPVQRPVTPPTATQKTGQKYAALQPQPGTAPAQNGVVRQQLDGNQITQDSIAQKLYDRSSAALRARRYGAAESGFKSFLRKYEKHQLASGAQFMLGETYYVQRNWRLAAQNYLKGYRKYPSGRRAGDTLLKLGMSLGKLGQKSQSCGAYSTVINKYKTSGAVAQAKKEMKRAGC